MSPATSFLCSREKRRAAKNSGSLQHPDKPGAFPPRENSTSSAKSHLHSRGSQGADIGSGAHQECSLYEFRVYPAFDKIGMLEDFLMKGNRSRNTFDI